MKKNKLMQAKRANLIVAGVSKCGSTSLFSYLAAHPDVCGSNVKETQFFMPLKFDKARADTNCNTARQGCVK